MPSAEGSAAASEDDATPAEAAPVRPEQAVTQSAKESRPDVTELRPYLIGPYSLGSLAMVGVWLLGTIAFFYFAKSFLLPVVLAILLNFLLKPVVNKLVELHVPRVLAAAAVLVLFIGVISSIIYGFNKPAAEWLKKAPASILAVEEKVRWTIERAERLFRHGWTPEENPNPADQPPPAPLPPERRLAWAEKLVNLGAIVGFTAGFLVGSLETLVLLFFLMAAPHTFVQKLVRILPKMQEKKEAVEIAREVEQNISTFLFTITLINIGVALVVALVLLLLRLPNPFFWGAIAGLLNFIPYFGPLTMFLMLILAGFLTFDSGRALLPPLCYLAVHAVESNFITPTVLGRRLTLNPVIIFASLMFWTWLWGVPGALLAVPLLMTFKILCDHFHALAAIAEFLDG